ncbi:MAG: DJ-1/PfpI family protein [Lachnospiraceae bacterium]|nr:DJ-1/PfpI family protein [Lachnospiraceae bacterium]
MSQVCIFLAEGFEEIEALTVVDILRRAGIGIQTVSITGEKQVVSSHKVPVMADALFEDIDFAGVDMIVLPGGMPGTKNLEAHEGLMAQVDAFYEQGKWLSAICAAPSIYGHKGMLKGKKACCFPEFESHLEGAEVVRDPVCVSGKIITSRGMGTAILFGLEICAQLAGRQKADEIATKIIYTPAQQE